MDAVEAGREAWGRIQHAASFNDWVIVGRAILVGRAECQAKAGAPRGKRYAALIIEWLAANGLGDLRQGERFAATWLVENLAAVEAWRASLDEVRRRQILHPHSVWVAYRMRDRRASGVHVRRSDKNRPRVVGGRDPSRPSEKPSQDMIRFVASALRERWCNDVFRMAAIAAEASLEFLSIEDAPKPKALAHLDA